MAIYDFRSVLLEADKKSMNKTVKINPDNTSTQYDEGEKTDLKNKSDDTPENEDVGEASDSDNSNKEENSTDYQDMDTEDNEDVSDTSNSDDTSGEADDENSDYTAMDDESDTDDTDISSSDEDNTDDDSSTEEDITDDNSDTSSEDTVNSDGEKNNILINDFINLYYQIKSIQTKVSNVDKGNIIYNTIISRVSMNLSTLIDKLYDYIVLYFSDKYINNLYQYNFFIQALKINIEMLRKIKDFNVN